jgi:hypothetical protein
LFWYAERRDGTARCGLLAPQPVFDKHQVEGASCNLDKYSRAKDGEKLPGDGFPTCSTALVPRTIVTYWYRKGRVR